MTAYTAPLDDMRFAMRDLGLLKQVAALPGCHEASEELVGAVLEEAGKLAANVVAPLNAVGDRQGATLENGVVRVADGFAEAYRSYVDGGWNGIPFDPEYGGQGLPWLVATAVQEMWQSASMAWGLCPLLTVGAVELLAAHGTPEQKATYLPKMVSGDWTGTMNLTEPQAGSDLGALNCRAERDGDRYRIRGQKIFITWGEHEAAENIVHMVLARLPDAPEGSKGISLFLVPKYLPDAEGRPGRRNDLRCVSLEEKLGIHASPTSVMSFGDDDGAVGYLIGEENRGLNCMFTMMNNARLNVGLQGLAIAERAYQQARDYACERIQGQLPGNDGDRVAIIRHPDVRRMLMTMKAQIEAMRAFLYDLAGNLDCAKRHGDPVVRRATQARIDLLTPVAKAWCTDLGVELASLAVQVHGGMGFIEETGAAQYYRDARIAPIYEGTNGIQAQDLVARKLLRDGGAAAEAYIEEMRQAGAALKDADDDAAAAIRRHLAPAIDALETATAWLVEHGKRDSASALAGATPYLRLFGTVAGGAMMARAAAAALAQLENGDSPFHATKLVTARFYAENILPQAPSLVAPITEGHTAVLALAPDRF